MQEEEEEEEEEEVEVEIEMDDEVALVIEDEGTPQAASNPKSEPTHPVFHRSSPPCCMSRRD
jgi:hypothetical protein